MKNNYVSVLRKIIKYTKKDILKWIVLKDDKNEKYLSEYKITENKKIIIYFNYSISKSKYNIILEFKNYNNAYEIIEIYPYNILSDIKYQKTIFFIKILHKSIKKRVN